MRAVAEEIRKIVKENSPPGICGSVSGGAESFLGILSVDLLRIPAFIKSRKVFAMG
jgi:hypothetical protein